MRNIGSIIYGFEIIRSRAVAELNGVLYEMRHIQTGARLCWLDNGQANKLFAIAFTSLPADDTGVFHILEHSVLCGSEKYPVKEPFVELLKSSLNTFLNAMTYPDKTLYPVSSRNRQDYLNLVSVYLDAVFAPRFLRDERIFRQEGWRIDEEDGKPCFKGVVYNEMKGALSDELGLISRRFARLLFPDTPYGFNSGGAPAAIRSLSYEKFIETYRETYHPSNAYVYLDGSVPLEETLELLDAYFARYDQRAALPVFSLQKPVAAEASDFYEIKEGESLENKEYLVFGKILCDWKEVYKAQAALVLGDVIAGSNEAPLKKALLDSGLAKNINFSVRTTGQQPYVMIYIKGVQAGASARIMDQLRDEAKKLLQTGLDHAAIHAAINRKEFIFREPDEPQGLYRCAEILNAWQYGGDPLDGLIYDPLFARLRSMVDAGGYEALLQEIFLDEGGRAILHMQPSASLGAEARRAEDAEIQAVCAAWSAEEREANHQKNLQLQAWQQTPDCAEAIASIPVLKLSEIDASIEWTDTLEKHVDGMTVLYHSAPTQNIVYANAYFSLTDCDLAELTQIALVPKLLGKLPTKHHSSLELERLLKSYTGKMDFALLPLSIKGDTENSRPCLQISFSALRENLDKAMELMVDILKNTCWDKDKIRRIAQQLELNRSRIGTLGGHIIGVSSVSAPYSASAAITEATSGGAFYRWLHEFAMDFDARIDGFTALAERMQQSTICKKRLAIGMTAAQPCSVDRLSALLPMGSAVPPVSAYSMSMPRRIGISIPAQISFAAQGYHLKEIGMQYKGSMKVVEKILSLNYFWNEIRAKGGAYGASFSVGVNGNLFTYSYRDPSPAASLAANGGAANYLKDFCARRESLERYILSTISDDEPLRSPESRGQNADLLWLSQYTKADAIQSRSEMLRTTHDDVIAFAEALNAFAANGTICIVGQKSVIDECGEMTILDL